MSHPTIEHSPAALRAELVVYGAAVAALATFLLAAAPLGRAPGLLMLAALGLLLWSGLEYALHRHVQHGIEPFAGWHLGHHRPTTAWMGLSLLLGAVVLTTLVVLPAWWLLGPLNTSALALGLFTGYLGYTLTHLAVHRAALDEPAEAVSGFDWLRHRTVWHTRHHQMPQTCCYGVSTTLWDRVFGTTGHPH